MRTYQLYGLRVRSQWPLPCPEVEESLEYPSNVELVESQPYFFSEYFLEAEQKSASPAWQHTVCLADGSIYLCWPKLFQFLISSDGCRIAGCSLGDASWEAFQTYLLGQVLSFALIKQGIEPIHCTALLIDGRAIGLLGDCGYGKSTLAAAFLQAGYPLLTDDLLVLKEKGKGFSAYPSSPRIKLIPEIAHALLGGRISGNPMNPFTNKLIIPLTPEQSCQESTPLKAFFVLRPPQSRFRGTRVTIRTIPKRRACLDLIANTFNTKVTEPERQRRLLAWASRLANIIPVNSLSYPRDLTRLPEVVEAIVAYLAKKH